MKLSKLYCNRPREFGPIAFGPGLNAVVAEIRVPENKKKDTHNLGKTTLGRMLDFCLLASRDANFFLFKHLDRFKAFVFYLEVELYDGSYATLRRSVAEPSKISFKRHRESNQDFTALAEVEWDHWEVAFDRAREIADGIFDLRAINPWSFRKGLGYQLRTQEDYLYVFQLSRFAAAHSDWKPYLAHILGFDSKVIADHYTQEDALAKKQEIAQTIRAELGGSEEDMSKIEGMLLLKKEEAEKRQQLLDSFDFSGEDREKTRDLVEETEVRLSRLNAKRYSLTQSRKKVALALEEGQILFDPDEAAELFKEAGVAFQGQIKKDFQQLIAFNKAITDERRQYLREERRDIELELKRVQLDINDLGRKRSDALAFLSTTDSVEKYKKATDELVVLKADIAGLERRRSYLTRLQELRDEIRDIDAKKKELQIAIERDVEAQNSNKGGRFTAIRLYFNEVVHEVLNRGALLSVSQNKAGHLEFAAEILDDTGKSTSADLGHTYRKLLCIAFDMAVVRAHLEERFPKFIFHDGIFESLDDRKKENLVDVMRRYAQLGVQHIITLIDSDLPPRVSGEEPLFPPEEICLTLHDEGADGRLFRIDAW